MPGIALARETAWLELYSTPGGQNLVSLEGKELVSDEKRLKLRFNRINTTIPKLIEYTQLSRLGLVVFSSSGHVLGAGMVGGNDPLSQVSACVDRVLARNPVDNSGQRIFTHVSKFVVDKIVKQVELAIDDKHVKERDNGVAVLVKLLKKPVAYVTGLVEHFEDSELGWFSNKWKEKGFFVKNESNFKSWLGRARGIYPMAEVYCYLLAPVLVVQEMVYGCDILKRWQIKHLTNQEVYAKLRQIFDGEHCSTDYSSFEKAQVKSVREPEKMLVCAVLQRMGMHNTSALFAQVWAKERRIKTRFFSFCHLARLSGDYWTSMGNGLVNICLILSGHWEKCGHKYRGLEEWWQDASQLSFVVEGDDGVMPVAVANPSFIGRMGLSFSLSSKGAGDGCVDFLRKVWTVDGCVVNVLRAIRSLWIKTSRPLRWGKRMFLLRVSALSMYYMQPGHPILTSLVELVGKLTAGVTGFKNWERWFNQHRIDVYALRPEKRFPVCEPNLGLAAHLADSRAAEIPRLAAPIQRELERKIARFDGRPIETYDVFCEYPEYEDMLSYQVCGNEMPRRHLDVTPLGEVRRLVDMLLDPAVETLDL